MRGKDASLEPSNASLEDEEEEDEEEEEGGEEEKGAMRVRECDAITTTGTARPTRARDAWLRLSGGLSQAS